MILFFSKGRLGNQLFQYAFLNTVAKKNEKILAVNMKEFVDTFNIDNPNFRHFVFGKYSKFLIRKFLKPFLLFLVRLGFINYITQDKTSTSRLPTFTYRKGLLPVTLVESDFFQSEKFFDKNKINFSFKEEYIKRAEEFLSKIPKKHTRIFVHIRRGDYIFESYLGYRGIDLPKSYYLRAMGEITKDVKDPFFIFLTDDPGYVECCFEEVKDKIISQNCMATDLAIMSLCEYGIVSNSSFSWWGAYMMKNKKKVIFPKYWYGWKRKMQSHVGIYPEWAEIIEP